MRSVTLAYKAGYHHGVSNGKPNVHGYLYRQMVLVIAMARASY